MRANWQNFQQVDVARLSDADDRTHETLLSVAGATLLAYAHRIYAVDAHHRYVDFDVTPLLKRFDHGQLGTCRVKKLGYHDRGRQAVYSAILLQPEGYV